MRRGTVFVLLCVAVVMTIAGGPALSQEKDYDAPPELRDTGRHLRDLFRQERYADIHAICEAGYAQAANDEARAFFLHKRADAYVAQDNPRGLDLLYQVLYWFPATMQAPLVALDLADISLAEAAAATDPARAQMLAAHALAMLDYFVRTYPTHQRLARALWKRGTSYELLGSVDAALGDYHRAVDLGPLTAWTHYSLKRAIALEMRLARWDDAIASARRYLTLFPEDNPAGQHFGLGMLLSSKGDFAAAIAEFDTLLRLYPEEEEYCRDAIQQRALCAEAREPGAAPPGDSPSAALSAAAGSSPAETVFVLELAGSVVGQARNMGLLSEQRVPLSEVPAEMRGALEHLARMLAIAATGRSLAPDALHEATFYVHWNPDGTANLVLEEADGKHSHRWLNIP